MTDACDALSALIGANRGRIIERWIAHIKSDPVYAAIPSEEIKETVSTTLDAYHAHVCARDPEPLNNLMARMAARRLDIDFPLISILRAFDGFRVVVTPMLLEDTRRPGLMVFIESVFDAVNHARTYFTEHYREMASAKLRIQMKELQTALQQLTEEKERAERAVSIKDSFLSNVSHEFRTPLTVIMGFSRLLAAGVVPADKAAGISELIHKSGETLLEMVNDIILMSKLENGHEKLYVHFVYVADLIKNAAAKVGRDFSGRKNIWEFDLPGREIFIVGDHQKLEQLFLNIFSNAVKFSPAGSKVSARARIDHEKNLLLVEISDEGDAIPASIRDSIFDKFSGKAHQGAAKRQGLGRGLALARMIANIHGGDVALKSAGEKKGNVFAVTLSLNPGFTSNQPDEEVLRGLF